VLGQDTVLHNHPRPEPESTHIAEELNLPVPIRMRAFESRVFKGGIYDHSEASTDHWADEDSNLKSLTVWAPDWPKKGAAQPIPHTQVIPADLSDWSYRAPQGFIAVDPVRGRMVFPSSQLPKKGVKVHYHYAFSADLGGGEYRRTLTHPLDYKLYRVGEEEDFTNLRAALDAWMSEREDHPTAVIEVQESSVYTEPLNLELKAGENLQIRAASGARPVLRLLDYVADRPDAFSIHGARGSRFTLDGFLVTGRGLKVYGPDLNTDSESTSSDGDLCDLRIRHCTLVPGWGLHCDCEPKHPSEPSIELINTRARLKVQHSILGAIHVVADEVQTEPAPIEISDSILDATSEDRMALGAQNLPAAFARLSIWRSTIFGQVLVHALEMAENCIFTSLVKVVRRQVGCVRYCYVPAGSRTPRRHRCQPDQVIQALGSAADDEAKMQARQRVLPLFTSTRYGDAAYAQLSDLCAEEITRGADDESEMGVFHDLFQPQRAANLRARLDEFTPAGMETGIFYAT
jgi:hypothetical protein